MPIELETERLILRQWKQSDYFAFAKINADPEVMRFFPAVLSKEESDTLARRYETLITERGWGFWGVELKNSAEFLGFVGLHYQDQNHSIPNTPFIEIGWRLSSQHWGKGYATEAANEALKFAFDKLNQTDVYAFTALQNKPSRRVMVKLGMENTGLDFNHPASVKGHPLERRCLYRITKTMWQESTS